jgi:alpha-beta hydrolase superfamily lysophospholipase
VLRTQQRRAGFGQCKHRAPPPWPLWLVVRTQPRSGSILANSAKLWHNLAAGNRFMIRWFEHRQVYVPSAVHDGNAADLGRPFEEAFFSAGDGVRLHGWFFPAEPQSARADQVILLLHGNGGNISHRLGFYQVWLETGVNVFAFDYRGYGRSEGRPSEEGTYLDAQAAYGWLRQKGFAPGNIIALGKSLGGGIASELTVRETLGGLVLQSTFTSIADVGSELFPWLPVRWANSIQYNTHSKLPGIKIPVLVMHSRDDRLIRYHHGQKNFAAANEPKMFWEIHGHHTGVLAAGRAHYLEGLNQFLGRVDATSAVKLCEGG